MKPRAYLLVSGTVFGAVALAHLSRLISRWPIAIGRWSAPHWVSVPGFIVPGALSVWAFLLASGERDSG